ncbi:glycosyltransferase [Bartonella tamiae]|uniref:Glycosyltransferase 2-like domain-containing protein n=1 Tax=Bartonella tamiae Th239 TaxID=1094558 RepID=J0R0I0_9HYPH|nr:glycosyltransferase [Bartonella tamiae]EJF89014.1 hypothetical protein ME5_01565 [Bartonella tamiae Th239]EJF94736.1 hypothetical protein MEG_00317 [Bartonella tamiae Th307]
MLSSEKNFALPETYREILEGAHNRAKLKNWTPSPHRFTCLPDYIIVIPAQNEEKRIINCLDSCAQSMNTARAAGRILLIVNNTNDLTSTLARKWAQNNPFALDILDITLPKKIASAGYARALGFDIAHTLLNPRGVILTTDADSLVDKGWIGGHLHAATLGAALTCGHVIVNNHERAYLPDWLLEKAYLEQEYLNLSRKLQADLDPDPFNPWPHHGDESGANMSIVAFAFDHIGGAPRVTASEDRELVKCIIDKDMPVHYCNKSRVTTSMRLHGRARGGMAETMKHRLNTKDYLCDERIERADMIAYRITTRQALRTAYKNETECLDLLKKLGLNSAQRRQAMHFYTFGAMWHYVEKYSPYLRQHRLCFSEMIAQLPRLRQLSETTASLSDKPHLHMNLKDSKSRHSLQPSPWHYAMA